MKRLCSYKILTPSLGAVLLLMAGGVSAAQDPSPIARLTAMSPEQISRGEPATVSLSFENLAADVKPALQPAAPFATHFLPLDLAPRLLAAYHEQVFAATGTTIYRLDFSGENARILGTTKVNQSITALQIADNRLLAGTGEGQLLTYAINDATLDPQGSATVDGAVTDIAIAGDKAYVLQDRRTLLKFSLPLQGAKSKPQATVTLPSAVNAITANAQYVYVSGDELGMQIVEFSDKGKAQLRAAYAIGDAGEAIRVDGSLAFVAGGDSGLTVFDVSNTQQPRWLGSHNKLGAVHDVAVYQGIIAIVNNENERLVSLDVSNPELPITDSIYQPRMAINDLLVQWPYAYVATELGVEQVDFASSAAMQISNEGINQGGSRRAFIQNDLAYVADWFSGLHIYDISLPHAPRHLGNFHTPGSSKGVVVRDKIAFVGDDDHGLQIIDVSDPHQPRKISEVLSTGLAYTMKLVGDLVYLADHRGGFHIIDVSDLLQPKVIGSYDTPGKSWALDVADGIAYVADDSSGLLVFDVHNPAAIELIGQFNPGGYAEDVKLSGKHAYVAFFDKGFYILDISNPREPKLTGHTPIPGNARSVSLQGPYAYIAGWESGMQVVDIRKLTDPHIVAYYDTDGSAWGLDVYQDHAYIWDWWGGVKVVDISNPLQPRAAGRYHGRGLIQRLAIHGDYLYTANGAGGMQVYDIKNPLNPIWATGLDVSGSVLDIALTGNQAYLAADDNGVVIADISDAFYIRWLSRLQTAGRVLRVVADASLLVAQDSKAGLLVVDVSRPQAPRITARLPGDANDFWLQGNRLYVTTAREGLTVYELNAERQPELLARYAPQGEANWVRTIEDIVVLHEAGLGIRLLRRQGQSRQPILEPMAWFAFRGAINDIRIQGQRLFAASDTAGLLDIDISNPAKPLLSVVYPPTVPLTSLAVNEQAVFVGGDRSVNSVSRLQDIVMRQTDAADFQLQLPADTPLGNYQLSLIQPDGARRVLPQTLAVKPKPSNKPKFTMEDFKKILEQQKLNNPSTAAPQ